MIFPVAFHPFRSASHSALALALAVAPVATSAAQTAAEAGTQLGTVAQPTETAPGGAAAVSEIDFSADTLDFDNTTNVVTASGNVIVVRGGQRLRADTVRWNRTTGAVEASGNVIVTDPDGTRAYGDRIELTDSLRDGAVDNMLIVMGDGARFAAQHGVRRPDGDILLDQAVYSPCPVETDDGCPREPSWQIKAEKVEYDRDRDRARFRNATFELFGMPIIPIPKMSTSFTGPDSGLLMPNMRIDRTNGFEVSVPYYWRIAPNRDLTLTPHLYTGAAPMLQAEYRELTSLGSYSTQVFGTYSSRIPVGSVVGQSQRDVRGYIHTAGRFQLDPRWSLTASLRAATDRTFLRRYDISRDDRLRSLVSAERNGGSSYLTIQGWAIQTLRVADSQGAQPLALPLVDFRQRLGPIASGQAELQFNTLALTRTHGQDTQRAFASARWDLRRLTPWGQVATVTALVRGDIYHSSQNLLTPVLSYRGQSGWQTRGIAAVAADMRWPLIGQALGGTQTLTPRVQIVATPPIRNSPIPNEDSRAFDLDDTNIFALNRFPGHDRFEDGARVTYGLEWTLDRPGMSVQSVIGQSYRLDNKASIFLDGTGLTSRTSDVVGRTTVAFRDMIRLSHRFRLDKDNLAVRRNEFDVRVGNRDTYAEVGYMRLNRNIVDLAEDLRDREEIRAGGRWAIDNRWSVFGSAIVDLTGPKDDPAATTDGFTPIRHRLGIAWADDCLTLGVTWLRNYRDNGDARRGNSYLFRIALRNMGF